ncbi:MAG: DUF2271 domain-containing protein [Isosphaeraceae bacterium]
MRSFRSVFLAALVANQAAADDAPTRREVFTFFHENVMGTSMELRILAVDHAEAARAEERALAEIERLSALLGNHDPSSEFRRWQASREGPLAVSPELFEVLSEADHWRDRTGGAFDPRVQAVSALWTRCALEDRLPTAAERASALATAARSGWRLDPATQRAERFGDAPFSLDAIAKGFIVERACLAVLHDAPGVRGVVLNVGGDLHARGDLPATVGVAPPWADSESAEPIARFEARDASVATSGHSQRGSRIQKRWYSHVIDPRTGEPVARVLGATVLAPRGAEADAMATALNVLTPEEGLRLVDETPGAACLIVTDDHRILTSARWPRESTPKVADPLAVAATAPVAQADAFELTVSFEINTPPPGEGRYRRPYVAVWVENQEGYPVRNLLLWVSQGGSGPFQWLPDLKRWFKSDLGRKKVEKTEMVLTMSRPTRPPGKYSVTWDGKDTQGKPVPPGEYTVYLDAAREHGTYQGMSHRLTIGGEPFSADLKGGVEIKSATVAYRRKPPAP